MNNEELVNILLNIAQNKVVLVERGYIYLASFVLVTIMTLGYFLLKKFLGNKIEGLHQKNVLKFQNDLDQHNELLKYELYKTAKNAELFIKNQHELYPKIYALLVEAHGAAYEMEQAGYATASFLGFSEEEIINIIDEMHVPADLKKEIKEELPNCDNTFKKYNDHLPHHLANRAGKAVNSALNFWVTRELYFSKAANVLIKQVVVEIQKYVRKNKLRLNPQYSSLPREEVNCLDGAQKLLEELKEILFQEMKGSRTGDTILVSQN